MSDGISREGKHLPIEPSSEHTLEHALYEMNCQHEMRDITRCVLCGKNLDPDRKHVDTCGERCFKALLRMLDGHPERDSIEHSACRKDRPCAHRPDLWPYYGRSEKLEAERDALIAQLAEAEARERVLREALASIRKHRHFRHAIGGGWVYGAEHVDPILARVLDAAPSTPEPAPPCSPPPAEQVDAEKGQE